MFFLGAISEPLIYCLIGEKWHEASTNLPLICIAGSLYPLHAINLNMLQVQGRSDLFLGLEVVKKVLALLPLFVGAFVGIIPMLYVNLITGIISFFLNSHYSGKYLYYLSWMQLKDVVPSYGVAFIVAASVYSLKDLPLSYWVILPLQIILGIVVLALICKLGDFDEYKGTKSLVEPVIGKITHKSKLVKHE